MSWVVDASVAVKWVIPEVLSDEADRVRDGDDEPSSRASLPL
jgi:predicted nucleic acid-binding protein